MVNICQRGKRAERELANWLKDNGCPSARRTQQYCGTEGTSDVVAVELPHWHIEHKATKSSKITPSQLKKWLEQVHTDCPDGQISVIINSPDAKERVGILPQSSMERLQNTRSINSLALKTVYTFLGKAALFSDELSLLTEEAICNGHDGLSPSGQVVTYGLVGRVLTSYGYERYIVLHIKEWLQKALDFEATFSYAPLPSLAQELSVPLNSETFEQSR